MQRIFSKREKTILFTTIGVILFSVIFNILIMPIVEKNSGLDKEAAYTRLKLNKYLWLLSQKQNLQEKFSRFSSGAGLLDGRQKDMQAATLAELETMARDSGVVIVDIRPQGRSETQSKVESIIDIRCEAPMQGQMRFIYKLENSPLILRIRRCQFTAKPNSQNLEGAFSLSQQLL